MSVIETIISDEEWAEKYDGKSEAEQKAIFASTLGPEIHCGYGYYGCWFKEKDGKHVVVWNCGSSCDQEDR